MRFEDRAFRVERCCDGNAEPLCERDDFGPCIRPGDAAACNVAAISYHFGSKQDFYAAVLEHAMAGTRAFGRIVTMTSTKSPGWMNPATPTTS